jgi:hypothetical protein
MPAFQAVDQVRGLAPGRRERALARLAEKYDLPLREIYTLYYSPPSMGVAA